MNIYKAVYKLRNKCDRLEAELEESRRNVRDAKRNTNRYVSELQTENEELTERLESWQLSHKRLEDDYRELSSKARHVTFTDELEDGSEFTTNHTFFTKLKPDRIASLIDDIKSQNEPLEQAEDMVEALKDELENTVSELASVKAENKRLSKLLAMHRMGFTTNG